MKRLLLKNLQIYTEDQKVDAGYIKIEDQKITEIGLISNLTNTNGFEVIEIPSKYVAVPGFIDVHIHGVNGADTMDATKEALDTMVTSLPSEGTTSFLATTITQSSSEIEKALINVKDFIQSSQPNGQAEILGIHLEGPFVNAKMAGAQPREYIIDPNVEVFKKWEAIAEGNIKLVTMSPERPGGLDLVHYLKSKNVIASIGHTDATYDEVLDAIDAGANHVTHLFNQMKGLHHREPGVVGAAFLRDELMAELIVDGIHVRPEIVKVAYKQKGKERLILITDAMRAKCLKNGKYDLGGQEVFVGDGKAVLKDGTLAGSILRLGQGVKNMISFANCSLHDAIQMASVNPAKQLKVFDRKGSISVGKDADIVILDENLNVIMTYCRGKLAFQKEEK